MRHNVAITTLVACLIGLSAADETREIILRGNDLGAGAGTSASQVVLFDALPTPAIISQFNTPTTTFVFTAHNVTIEAVKLKKYNTTGSAKGDDDTPIKEYTIYQQPSPPASTVGVGEPDLTRADTEGIHIQLNNESIVVEWGDESYFLYHPLYLECEWKNKSFSGSSTSQLFVVFDKDPAAATSNLTAVSNTNGGIAPPARQEIVNLIPNSPPGTTPTPATTSPTVQTSQPGATLGVEAPSSQSPNNGLSKAAIIGVAVGASVGGLLLLGALAWLLCVRNRRRRSRHRGDATTHHMMPSYASDLDGAHAMISDKEMPAMVRETSSSPQQSAYDGRPSADLYAPYSDRRRSAASPAPASVPVPFDHHRQSLQHEQQHQHQYQHRRSVTGGSAGAGAGASETDLNGWNGNGNASVDRSVNGNGRGAPTPTSLIASRYAHLVEEGMTEDEIRRLEEEERQLDAAIEHAGRRGGPS
ncbi:hypothetical protein F5Y07DRAFT_142431 [Xylaria sp. FL0933]|nr:hypothetical protein F5Y07DRAFT_142431 [Xylaria sp. FL0933]